MTPTHPSRASGADIELAARRMMPGPDEVQQRLAFLEFGPEDHALLHLLHERLAPQLEPVIGEFYRHLHAEPELRALLADERQFDKLQHAQLHYFSTLTAGRVDADYVCDRARVGLAHQRIGLAPHWYIGAYRKYLATLLPRVAAVLEEQPELVAPAFGALAKMACFDLGVALDTYIASDRAELNASEERFRAAFGQAAVGLAQLDANGHWLRTNHKLQQILGYSEAELAAMTLADLLHAEEQRGDMLGLHSVLAGRMDLYSREARYRHKDGHLVWVNATFSPMRTDDGALGLIAVVEDIARRKQYEQELMMLANHDVLTGLANRGLLLDRLAQATHQARRSGRPVAVLFFDLDRFKYINDSLGHDAGDQVLVELAGRLSRTVRGGDTVARLGGDEFVVLLPELAHADDAALIGHKLLAVLGQPMMLLGQEITPAASVGISLAPKDGSDGPSLLKNADAAMYRAKRQGGSRLQFYAQEMNARSLDLLKLEASLRHALERDEFLVHYQPQIAVDTNQIVGVEALLRWQPPGRAMVLPADFIPVAEETGLIGMLGQWVLEQACRQQAAWTRAGLRPVRVAVNLSARQFRSEQLVQGVAGALAASGCPADCLELELTESVLMENPEAATAVMQQLSEMGVQLSIDDFGSGYSSLAYLKRFPINALKIDRAFVRDIPADADDAAIATAVIALAHSMKLTVVAEGVETAAQLEFMRERRCDLVQGYYFSRPVPPDQLAALLTRRERG
jgi:diguanylate cyclase (GGDEF)-like protein/PAS domain S-box-containing protein